MKITASGCRGRSCRSAIESRTPAPRLEAPMGMDAAIGARRGGFLADILRRVRNEGEGLSRGDQRAAEIDALGPAKGDGLAVALADQRDAAHLLAFDQLLEIAPRLEARGPTVGADLPRFGGIDAVQAVFLAADFQGIAVDHAL